jgi:hypothetical protein
MKIKICSSSTIRHVVHFRHTVSNPQKMCGVVVNIVTYPPNPYTVLTVSCMKLLMNVLLHLEFLQHAMSVGFSFIIIALVQRICFGTGA